MPSFEVDVLVPTVGRVAELAVTLSGLAAQCGPSFRVVLSDQSDTGAALHAPVVVAMIDTLDRAGHPVDALRHLPRRGLAEHRDFLLRRASADHVLFLDDDVWLEPGSLARMRQAIADLGCGFVGCAPQGLSFLGDRRPEQERPFEPWPSAVQPERIRPGSAAVERWPLHSAANLAHIAARLPLGDDDWLAYRVAWIGACVLYDRAALVACGGFDFWSALPPGHAGEDVAAQWRLMERHGGAGLLPSGAVHLEAPTTVTDRRTDAPAVVFAGDA